jgi:putative flippase GtrA
MVGVFGNGLNLGATFALTEWAHLYYLVSYILATFGTWAIMFFLHSRITFSGHEKNKQHLRFLKFITVYGTAFALNFMFVYILTERLEVYYLLSIASVTLILSIGTFLVNKSRVFNAPARRVEDYR